MTDQDPAPSRHGAGIERRGVGGPPPAAPAPQGRPPGIRGARRPPRGPLLPRRAHHDRLLPGPPRVPLTELFENRDYQGSTHFSSTSATATPSPSSTCRGLDLGPYAEVPGGLAHLAISVEPERWAHLKAKLDDRGIAYAHIDGTSIYSGPDGERIELIADPLGEMYGSIVL
ncbi:MAG: VOC family protein [Acidimicrobiales bacterium]